jgi:hypothetical protein
LVRIPLPNLFASDYDVGIFREKLMAKGIASKGRFVVQSDLGSSTIRDTETGKTFALKGYGALKGEYSVKKGINLAKPILAQTEKKKARPAPQSRYRASKQASLLYLPPSKPKFEGTPLAARIVIASSHRT